MKAPFRDETGKIVGVITYNRDITEQKKNAQLKGTNLQLHQPLGGKADHLAQEIGIGVFSTSARRFIMSSVIGGSFESGWCQQTDPSGRTSMTTAMPLARYGAAEGALASGFATAELHHVWGRDPETSRSKRPNC
ncbi:hypothetical protein P9272_28470 [Mesorhizobium sp. WSM4976]|uniref:hypothetical protein n=1 Tax=Mesorhizobium sp. WSM4976 TaxID=3038549 RepID=UPI002417C8CE|nr:hypothetical protein [Mesorhizobium sp. WSM4976]MDG4897488.1 hypothetical protein [Mesorhizobium sp. WSM4976]